MDAQIVARDTEIWQLYELGVPKTKIAERVGVHRNTVAYILAKDKGGTRPTSAPEPAPSEDSSSADAPKSTPQSMTA